MEPEVGEMHFVDVGGDPSPGMYTASEAGKARNGLSPRNTAVLTLRFWESDLQTVAEQCVLA